MACDSIMKLMEDYLRALHSKSLPVESLVLYGSYARGEEREESDIDVLLLLNDSVPREQMRNIWTQCDLIGSGIDTRIQTWPVHVSRFQSDEGSPLLCVVRQEGIPIAA